MSTRTNFTHIHRQAVSGPCTISRLQGAPHHFGSARGPLVLPVDDGAVQHCVLDVTRLSLGAGLGFGTSENVSG